MPWAIQNDQHNVSLILTEKEKNHVRECIQGHRTRRIKPGIVEAAAQNAVKSAGMSLRDLRIAEVSTLDMKIGDNGKDVIFRARVKLSFKILSD